MATPYSPAHGRQQGMATPGYQPPHAHAASLAASAGRNEEAGAAGAGAASFGEDEFGRGPAFATTPLSYRGDYPQVDGMDEPHASAGIGAFGYQASAGLSPRAASQRPHGGFGGGGGSGGSGGGHHGPGRMHAALDSAVGVHHAHAGVDGLGAGTPAAVVAYCPCGTTVGNSAVLWRAGPTARRFPRICAWATAAAGVKGRGCSMLESFVFGDGR
jgi:hypothetical protein